MNAILRRNETGGAFVLQLDGRVGQQVTLTFDQCEGGPRSYELRDVHRSVFDVEGELVARVDARAALVIGSVAPSEVVLLDFNETTVGVPYVTGATFDEAL